MENLGPFLAKYKQNYRLPIRLVAPDFGQLPLSLVHSYGLTHRKPHYFFIFMIEGKSSHGVDLDQLVVKNNELLFILPNQIHRLPLTKQGTMYYKLAFGEECLSMLPRQHPFLINPFSNQKVIFTPSVSARVKAVFEMLAELLGDMNTAPDLIMAHMNSLLTEINAAYFSGNKTPADNRLDTYISFMQYVEDNFENHPTIQHIAEKLTLNTNSLYYLVKHYAGVSPKGFITNRLMLEARRRLYYAESSSVKELAYDLGYNDPEYFSRIFKKTTGQTVSAFIQDLSGN